LQNVDESYDIAYFITGINYRFIFNTKLITAFESYLFSRINGNSINITNIFLKFEPGSSVSTVSGYGLDDRAIEVRFPAEARGFFL
jgi:hypothetical protein